MNKFKVLIPFRTATQICDAIRLYVLMLHGNKLNREQYYQLYIIRELYHDLERKNCKQILAGTSKEYNFKCNPVLALCMCEVIDAVQAPTMDLRDIRIELGRHVANILTAHGL